MEPSSSSPLDLLESALDQAFTASPPHEPVQPEVAPSTSDSLSTPNPQPEADAEPVESLADPDIDLWKSEYEAQVQSWRAQSAEAREKAEKERLKWEAIRTIERQEAAQRKAAADEAGPSTSHFKAGTEAKSELWESVAEFSTTGSASYSEADKPKTFSQVQNVSGSSPAGLPRTDSQLETATNESQKWEEVPSVSSSFPSMTFPENIEAPRSQPQAAPQQPAGSVTLAIFDSSLSTRTRMKAFFSSLAINLLLPFVNGVMLGFGEIFAKNVVMGWFGWNTSRPGSIASKVGLRGTREERQKQSR